MNGRMRTKAGLLSRVSTLALLAAAGSLGAVQQAKADCETPFEVPGDGTTINTNQDCVEVNEPVEGDVENNAIIGDPGDGFIPFHVYSDISGQLINDGSILGGYSNVDGERGALTISDESTIGNGIVNNGFITSTSGNGIQLGFGGENGGHILGGISNTNSISAGRYGVAALYGSLSGGLTNGANGEDATINGGLAAIYIADTFGTWNGGITNWGQISGVNTAIKLGDGDTFYDGGNFVFNGGIANNVGATIDANGTAISISSDVSTFNGGISNSGGIEGGETAILIQAATFNGGIYNTGQIDGLGGHAIWITSETTNFNGGITNFGQITGADDAIHAEATNWNGNFANYSFIDGAEDGFQYNGGEGSTFDGDVFNSGTITAGDDGVEIEAYSFYGNATNSGTITAEETGLAIHANWINGPGEELPSEITNTGAISAGRNAVEIIGGTVYANFTNTFAYAGAPAPQITSTNGVGVLLAADGTWTGNVTNDGLISGGYVGMVIGADDEGLSRVTEVFDGDIRNTGQILGDDYGVYVTANTISGNFTNEATGRIESGEYGTGVYISANTFSGDITNNGTIIGGGDDTGLHVATTGVHTGNIVNNGYLFAPSNALDVYIGEDLDGEIINTGTIEANYGAAVQLNVADGATFTNRDGGIILGNVVFAGEAQYAFIGEDGRIEGDLEGYGGEGEGNDDTITVRDGEQYFAYGTARNFASFTVEDGGIAVMGGAGNGYAFQNVDALYVNDGGMLFIDKPTTLVVDDTYTQQSGGTLAFYLGAPEDIESATGTIDANNETDYGQLIVNGTANLDGRIAGELDPAFANANPGLDTVVYNDVLIADEINGTFDEASLLQNSAIFQLSYDINPGDGVQTVDLFVNRTPLGHTSLGGLVVEATASFDNAVSSKLSMGGGCGGTFAGPGWCVTQYAANETGATQVLTDATPGEDPFTWLRARGRRVGETAAWGRVVGGWGDTDGDATTAGAKFDNVGGIVGVDHVFTPTLLAGLAAQWTATDIDFKGRPDKADVDSLEIGAYASYAEQNLYLNANVSYVWHEFDVRRFIGPDRALGDYNGDTISAYAEGGKTFQTEGDVLIQPFVAVSYSHLDTDAYAETGTNPGVQLNVQSTDFDSLRSSLGVRVGYPVEMSSGRMMVPEVRAGWAHEFLDDQSTFVATLQSGGSPVLITGEKYSRDTLVVGAGVSVPLADQVVAFVDYDTGLNDDITTHTVSGGLRVKW